MNAILSRSVGGVVAVCLLSAVLAGCNGGTSNNGTSAAAKTNVAPAGAGGASAPVPIVAMPGAGPCPASGTTALPSPSLNSQLRCAP